MINMQDSIHEQDEIDGGYEFVGRHPTFDEWDARNERSEVAVTEEIRALQAGVRDYWAQTTHNVEDMVGENESEAAPGPVAEEETPPPPYLRHPGRRWLTEIPVIASDNEEFSTCAETRIDSYGRIMDDLA